MSSTPPENGTSRATPLYDETIAAPTFEDLRVPEDLDLAPDDEFDDTPTVPAGPDASGPSVQDRAQQTKGAATGAAADVKGAAQDAGAKVASTAKEQASTVAQDAMGQARELYGQATTQLSEQAGAQQEKAASTLHTFADDLSSMGERSDGGLAAELVQTLETRARGVAEWLEHHEPQEVLDEVKQFAARRPGLFIALAAGTGIVAARLTKALVAEAKSDDEPSATAAGTDR